MEHVLVLADDIEQAREFYCDVVGLELGERPALEFPGYWLYAGATPCLHLAARSPTSSTRASSVCRWRTAPDPDPSTT
jgi:catechol 2,3-dioxygenase-like lactoylglutathione lyase family enzyme